MGNQKKTSNDRSERLSRIMRSRPSPSVSIALLALAAAVAIVMIAFEPFAKDPAPASSTREGPNAIRALAGCTANTLDATDDGSTGLVDLGFTANFFGDSHTQGYVNNNGSITFDAAVHQYTPFDFTTTGESIIAPFLADVDTSGAPGDGSLEAHYGTTTVGGHNAFCVNWVNVGYFNSHVDKLNSFQLLLIDRGDTGAGNFDVEFNYDKVQWETGDASGGTNGFGGSSAAVGFSNGDGDSDHFFVRDGSFQNGALVNGGPKALISSTLNASGQTGRYVFPVRNAGATGATLTGEVHEPASAGGDPLADAPVEICPTGPGTCVSRFTNDAGVYRAVNLPAGNYTVVAHATADTEFPDGHAVPVALSGTGTFNRDVTLGAPLTPLPPGTTITTTGATNDGFPVVHWTSNLRLTTHGCPGGHANYEASVNGQVVRTGSMGESPTGSGFYEVEVPALQPNHGPAEVRIAIDCPFPDPDENVDFGIWIDPSGLVHNNQTGAAIPGADVVLFRSADADGPFIQVADGNAIMSPGNRKNPDQTDADGRFGWDVLAGYYKVRASADGCTPGETAVLTIPPAVTDLDIRLACGGGGGGGGGGGAGAATPVNPTPPASGGAPAKKKKCKKIKNKKKRKKCKKKGKASASSWDALSATGVLTIGPSEKK